MSIDVKRLAVDAAYWDGAEVPDGATHYYPPSEDWYKKTEDSVLVWWAGIERWHEAGIPKRLNDEHIIPRPQSEWVDGSPPVGCECESATRGAGYRMGHITYRSDQVIVWMDKLSGHEYATRPHDRDFRPIQTPEQRQREEFARSILDDLDALGLNISGNAAMAVAIGFTNRGWRKEPKP